jgi:hypothetical protein
MAGLFLWGVHRSLFGTNAMSRKRATQEYHLICRTTGQSHGGFATLAGAREYAREEDLEAWDIFNGNRLVERRDPAHEDARKKGLGPWDIFRGHFVPVERREPTH